MRDGVRPHVEGQIRQTARIGVRANNLVRFVNQFVAVGCFSNHKHSFHLDTESAAGLLRA